MHELSIACSLVDLAVEAAERAGAAKVVAVKVVVGAFSGVSAEALLFSYDVAAAGTRLEVEEPHPEREKPKEEPQG
jgi:hydrogenase nickel incorporation protein HypA/HybF